jgi:hypothetical protein
VQIAALPLDLPNEFQVDLEAMDGPQSILHISDLVLTNNIELMSDPSELIARIEVIREEATEDLGETALEQGVEAGSPDATPEASTGENT